MRNMIMKKYFFNSVLHLVITVMTWTRARVVEGRATLPLGLEIPALIAFGDSIIDPGNNNGRLTIAKANYPPYGRDFMGGNRPTGRFSNGRLPTDFIASELGIKDYLPAYLDPQLRPEELLTGVSFASAASDGYSVDRTTKPVHPILGYRLRSMVGENRTTFILNNSIFLLVAGSDDIANTYFDTPLRRLEYDYNSYTDLMLNAASSFLQELYGLGARRLGVVGTPPIGCVPSQRTIAGGLRRQCAAKYNQVAHLFNSKLLNQTRLLKTNHLADAMLIYIDIYNIMADMIDNPMKYGLEVVDKGCCGTGVIEVTVLCNMFTPLCANATQYLFWDSYHPTENGYRFIFNSALNQTIEQILLGNF